MSFLIQTQRLWNHILILWKRINLCCLKLPVWRPRWSNTSFWSLLSATEGSLRRETRLTPGCPSLRRMLLASDSTAENVRLAGRGRQKLTDLPKQIQRRKAKRNVPSEIDEEALEEEGPAASAVLQTRWWLQ